MTITVDPAIAAKCPARSVCRQHEIMCAATCPWYIELTMQLSMAGIPKRHAKFTLATLPEDTVKLALLRSYGANVIERVSAGQGLYLYGGTGTGKTTAVCTLATHYIIEKTLADIRAGRRTRQLVAYLNVPDLLTEIKRGFDDKDVERDVNGWLDEIARVPLVVFDDVGSEKSSEWSRERLLTLINERYDAERTTFFTSNLTIPELAAPLGARLQSRIAGMTVEVNYDGKDRRRG
jgi:DNA replication protein DnaC